MPRKVSGVPPDAFSETGQLWGNPIYNFEKMKSDGLHRRVITGSGEMMSASVGSEYKSFCIKRTYGCHSEFACICGQVGIIIVAEMIHT